jgi:hypothetical protein
MVLISFELSLPLPLASWVVKVNVRTSMSYMLDKSLVENLMSSEYEYPNHATRGPKQVLIIVSIHVSSRTPTGYHLPDDMEAFPYQNDKTYRQWTPRHLFLF